MRGSVLQRIERATLVVTAFAIGGVAGLAILTANLALFGVFAVAVFLWLPTVLPYVVELSARDDGALERWVEVRRTRVETAKCPALNPGSALMRQDPPAT